MSAGIDVVRDGPAVRLTIRRPDRANAMTPEAVRAMLAALDEASADDGVRVIVLASEGKHFCSGMDFGHMDLRNGDEPPRRTALHRRIDDGPHRLLERLTTIEVPVVAAVRGYASAFGLGLALACDFVVASRTATFWAPFVQRGFTPDSGSSYVLPRVIGAARARDMLMRARKVSGEEAFAWGLVSQVVDDAALESAADELVAELAAAATTALGLTKWLLVQNADGDYADGLRNESLAEDISTISQDGKEGVKAFLARRDPAFGGR